MYKLAIVGRPNVGKSALFNRICKKRISIVDEMEGVTRDRIYGEAEIFGFFFEVIDTGGIDFKSKDQFQDEIRRQAEIAIQEADVLVMVVDGTVGMTDLDYELAKELLKIGKPLTLAVNKIDDPSRLVSVHEFHGLGISKMIAVSATHGYRVADLLEAAWEGFAKPNSEKKTEGIRVSVIGRPNVGKSTLVNQLLNEERCVVSPIAGTTRDSIDIPFTFNDKPFVLIDTAGIKRKKAEKDVVEKFAAIRTKDAIERSDVCLLVLDVQEGLTTQEKRIAKEIEEAGKGCVLVINKWDLAKGFRMEHCLKALKDECSFLAHCPAIFISALSGRNLQQALEKAEEVYNAANYRVTTHQLNKFIERSMQLNHPPMITGKRLRIYYMTQISALPPRFVLFVNYPELMTDGYKKYLINQMRAKFGFFGSPLQILLRGKEREKAEHLD